MYEKKSAIRIAKFKRWIGITKLIPLSDVDTKLIKFCKGHYKEKYPFKDNWVNSLKPLQEEIYGWSGDEHYHDYLHCMFGKLLNLHLRIKLDQSGSDQQLKAIFNAAFSKSPGRSQDLPIERAISELCGLIQNTTVIHYGVYRFNLTWEN